MDKEIRIELFRSTKPRLVASKELQEFINGFIKEGWNLKSILFHSDILAYEILLEKGSVSENGKRRNC